LDQGGQETAPMFCENSSSSKGVGQPLRTGRRFAIQSLRLSLCDSVLVEEFVIENGGRERVTVFAIVSRVLDADQPPLAEHVAVLLSGD